MFELEACISVLRISRLVTGDLVTSFLANAYCIPFTAMLVLIKRREGLYRTTGPAEHILSPITTAHHVDYCMPTIFLMTQIDIGMECPFPGMVRPVETRTASEKGPRIRGQWVEDELPRQYHSELAHVSAFCPDTQA